MCVAAAMQLIHRSRPAGWLRRASALLSSGGMVLLRSSPACHDACSVWPATLEICYALNDMISSFMTGTLTRTVLRAQSAWGKCGEPFMSGYCAQTCGRCSSGCSDVAPPGGFSCAQQVSRHCKPRSIVHALLCTMLSGLALQSQCPAAVAVGKVLLCSSPVHHDACLVGPALLWNPCHVCFAVLFNDMTSSSMNAH